MNPMIGIIADLRDSSRVFDGSQRRRKSLALSRAAKHEHRLHDPRNLAAYHEALLFIAAFPDDARIHAQAEAALRRMARTLVEPGRLDRLSLRKLAGSGIAGTYIDYAFSLDFLRWLAQRFPGDVEFLWRDASLGDAFEELLSTVAFPVEYDGLLEPRYSVREWMNLAAAGQHEVAWVVSMFDQLRAARCVDPALLDRIFDGLELRVRWRLGKANASRTLCRFPARPRFEHAPRGGATRPPATATVINSPLPTPQQLSMRESNDLIDVARASLAARSRETDPVAYANPRDVVLHRLDRGIDVMLLGMQPERRLPIEGFIGYVAAKNRIPIAYGGGWVAFDTCTIGINLFETFRGGESSHIFAQILRVYRGMFDVRTFRVDPYQFGEDNEEAIRSGAFWFYHRMGFRPTDPELCDLAQREADRIARDRSHRSSRATLRRLATSRLQMDIIASSDPPLDLGAASLAITHWIAKRFAGDRSKAAASAIRIVASALNATRREHWPAAERASFESLAMLVAPISKLARWPADDRKALLGIMRAKGGTSEMAYLSALRRHARLRAAVADLAGQTNAR